MLSATIGLLFSHINLGPSVAIMYLLHMHIHVLNNSDLLQYLDIVSSIWKLLLMMALELRKWTHDHAADIADSLYVFYIKV